eukprot:COSAG01_NODE_957_length_12474_cov_44.298182_13_plen_181_part_00
MLHRAGATWVMLSGRRAMHAQDGRWSWHASRHYSYHPQWHARRHRRRRASGRWRAHMYLTLVSADQPEMSPVSLEQPRKYLRTPRISCIVCMHVAAVLRVHKIRHGRWRQRRPVHAASSMCYVGDGVGAVGYAGTGGQWRPEYAQASITHSKWRWALHYAYAHVLERREDRKARHVPSDA